MNHILQTVHVQKLVRNALFLIEQIDGMECSSAIPTKARESGTASAGSALEKAEADLRRALGELESERLSCQGWRQV